MITVFATVTAKDGSESKVKEALLALVNPSRQESGCIEYHFYQGQDNPCEFVCFEEWESRSHLDQHMQTNHLRACLAKIEVWLGKPVSMIISDKISA
ncbi:Antibiotic biosynthesis monooxygenase [Legionella donaldsonii]|uniref:Antibiotic biosynthesis monooxygenase n=1 Tax=Legionella donaldsonii TaxID=45060 RepID=A0A378IZH6_9GAMM|nr:putative quinol monooxygenase [Legionella donaldsonii]STX40546.1 Antibiotic biosynthesis monooxygenase [Legionella donaldsonii]